MAVWVATVPFDSDDPFERWWRARLKLVHVDLRSASHWDPKTASVVCGVHEATVRKWRTEGIVIFVKVKGRLWIEVAALKEYLRRKHLASLL